MNMYVLHPSYLCEIWALCRLGIIYDYSYYDPCLARLALFGPLVQQHVTILHVTKCLNCHKAILEITGIADCLHDYVTIMSILLLWDLSTQCVAVPIWSLILAHCFSFFGHSCLHFQCVLARIISEWMTCHEARG